MVGPPRVYKQESSPAPHRAPGPRSVFDEANRVLDVLEVARELLEGKGDRRGQEVAFLCFSHDDRRPSLRVNAEKGLWVCDVCGIGGDAVRLAQLVWRYDRADVAAAEVLMLFGHEVPQRPRSWFRKQRRQAPVRDGLGRIKEEVLRRRLFRILEPLVSGISDGKERRVEAEYVWEELTPLAARMARDRSG